MKSLRVDANPVWLVSLKEKEMKTQRVQKEDHVEMQGESSTYKPGKETSEETKPAGMTILDLQPVELWNISTVSVTQSMGLC